MVNGHKNIRNHDFDDNDQKTKTVAGKIHFFIFIAIVVILLLNLLIAMMGDTYAKIAEIKNEWMRQVIFSHHIQINRQITKK